MARKRRPSPPLPAGRTWEARRDDDLDPPWAVVRHGEHVSRVVAAVYSYATDTAQADAESGRLARRIAAALEATETVPVESLEAGVLERLWTCALNLCDLLEGKPVPAYPVEDYRGYVVGQARALLRQLNPRPEGE